MLPQKYVIREDSCGDLEIPTRVGVIYEYSDTLLAVQCDGHPGIAAKLKRLGLRVHQDGDDEVTFLVPHEDLDAIAPLIRPRVRRRLKFSDADLPQRRELARTLAARRSQTRKTGSRSHAEGA